MGKQVGKQVLRVARASFFIFQSDMVEAHQGEQSVAADLKPLPQQSQRREVFFGGVSGVRRGMPLG